MGTDFWGDRHVSFGLPFGSCYRALLLLESFFAEVSGCSLRRPRKFIVLFDDVTILSNLVFVSMVVADFFQPLFIRICFRVCAGSCWFYVAHLRQQR